MERSAQSWRWPTRVAVPFTFGLPYGGCDLAGLVTATLVREDATWRRLAGHASAELQEAKAEDSMGDGP